MNAEKNLTDVSYITPTQKVSSKLAPSPISSQREGEVIVCQGNDSATRQSPCQRRQVKMSDRRTDGPTAREIIREIIRDQKVSFYRLETSTPLMRSISKAFLYSCIASWSLTTAILYIILWFFLTSSHPPSYILIQTLCFDFWVYLVFQRFLPLFTQLSFPLSI